MKYESNLIEALVEYGKLDDELAKMENRKKVLRKQIQDWMNLNETHYHEIQDNENQVWKLKVDQQERKSITDWNALTKVLGEKNAHLITQKVFDTFTVKKIKYFSKEWLSPTTVPESE